MMTEISFSGSAPPKKSSYSLNEEILFGIRGVPFSVKPINAGIAVSTSATEGGSVVISSTYTPGVLYVAILKIFVL
jgi:hypothetical protein